MIALLLAQATTDDAAFNWHVVISLLQIVTPVGALGVFLWKMNNPEKINIQQPLAIQLEKQFVDRKEFERHLMESDRRYHEQVSEFKSIRREAKQDKEDIISSIDEHAVKTHDRINIVVEKIGELRGEMNTR